MDNLNIIINSIDEKLKLSLESLKVRDILGEINLGNEQENYLEYLDMSVMQFLSLIKLNRLHKNKKIDDDMYLVLKNDLNHYYELKNKIAEAEHISYISDNLNIDNIIYNYVYLISSTFKKFTS